MTVSARTLYSMPKEDVWNLEDVLYEVQYEDDVVFSTNKKEIIFNRYCWGVFDLYPATPITSTCTVRHIVGSGFFNADTHVRLLEGIFKHICSSNNLNYYYEKDSLLKRVYVVFNDIYNNIVQRVSDSVSTIDATDFIGVVKDAEISKLHSNLKSNPESIDRAYKEIKNYVNNVSNSNRFISAYRSKAINENQANQCIGPRGFVTDLDRTVFKQPIMNGFIKGMGNLYELMTESRTAAKSLNANDTHIKTSEYASRRIQLLTMSVVGVETIDCGSTEYMDLFITQQILDNIKGKYYLTSSGSLDYIRGNETHLINNIIKLRTSFGCRVPDHTKICTTCLGKISENFKENSNLGYTMTAFLMEKMTQSILSTKHLTHSVKKSVISLTGAANKYFYTDDNNDIYFNKDINLEGLYLILPNSKLSKLVDVLNLQHSNISLHKVGELETIVIRDIKHKTPISESIDISYRDRLSIITKSLLEHIKSIKLESDSRGNFVIPIASYNKELPIFHNPLKETNIISFVNKIASIIETNKDKVTNPYEKLNMVFNLVIEQFKCNMSVIETIIYATTTYNAFNNNYRLGRDSQHPYCESKLLLFRNRSISQLLAYEEQSKEIISNAPVIFSNVNRMNHPMDVLFKPEAIVK